MINGKGFSFFLLSSLSRCAIAISCFYRNLWTKNGKFLFSSRSSQSIFFLPFADTQKNGHKKNLFLTGKKGTKIDFVFHAHCEKPLRVEEEKKKCWIEGLSYEQQLLERNINYLIQRGWTKHIRLTQWTGCSFDNAKKELWLNSLRISILCDVSKVASIQNPTSVVTTDKRHPFEL